MQGSAIICGAPEVVNARLRDRMAQLAASRLKEFARWKKVFETRNIAVEKEGKSCAPALHGFSGPGRLRHSPSRQQ
jgi:tRNA isopentenyl-2-thiomethyl-A-37 hydroxylase MiaE